MPKRANVNHFIDTQGRTRSIRETGYCSRARSLIVSSEAMMAMTRTEMLAAGDAL